MSYLARFTDPSQKGFIDLALVEFGAGWRRNTGCDCTRADGIATNVVLAVVAGDAAGETNQSMFCGCVGYRIASGNEALNGTDIDDRAHLGANHEGQRFLCEIL